MPIFSSRLSISVSTRETKNDATEWILDRSWPASLACFESGQVGVHHRAVPFDREDQRHVHRNAFGDNGGDRRQSGQGGGDLDQQVRPVDDLPQLDGLQDRFVGVVGQARVDLDRHPAVDAAGRLVLLASTSQALRTSSVVTVRMVASTSAPAIRQLVDLIVVGGALRQRSLEDRRVGGHTDNAFGVDEFLQVAGLQSLARQVVQPYGDARRGQGREIGVLSHCSWPFVSVL